METPRVIGVHEQVLYRLIRDPAAREELDHEGLFREVESSELEGVAALIREQQAARLRERFPVVFEACPDPAELLARLGIPDGCLEEAFYTIVSGLDLVDPQALRHAYHRALVWIVEDDLVWAAVGTRVVTGPLAALTRSGGSPART